MPLEIKQESKAMTWRAPEMVNTVFASVLNNEQQQGVVGELSPPAYVWRAAALWGPKDKVPQRPSDSVRLDSLTRYFQRTT